MNITAHWDIVSMIFYVFLGIVGATAIKQVKSREVITGYNQRLNSLPYIIWIVIWLSVAVLRYVSPYNKIGGADASTYINYFRICLDKNIPLYYEHYDILYRLLNQFLRLFISDYQIFFIFVYGIMIISYILFLNEFCPPKINFAPFVLIFFIYLRGFNTIRTNLGVAVILVGMVLLNRKHFIWAYIFAFSSFFIQKASILYALFLPFYFFYYKKRMKVWHCIALTIIAAGIALFARNFILQLGVLGVNLDGAYVSYARRSLSTSFFDNFWKITLEQLLLGVGIIILNKRIRKDIDGRDEKSKKRLDFIWVVCMFDFITIPIIYVLGIWRGYEYMYLGRLIMWGELIYVAQKSVDKNAKKIIYLITPLLFITWMIFRVYNTWEDSGLMPYVLNMFVK